MGKHDHASCEHLVAWCRHCDVVFCKNPGCGMEWVLPCTRPHYLGGQPWQHQFNVIPMGSRMTSGSVPVQAYQQHGAGAEARGALPDIDPYQKPGHTHHTP